MSLSPDTAARLMMVNIPGLSLDAPTRDHLRRYNFGGVCLLGQNCQNLAQLQILLRDLRDLLGPGAWIAIDQEGGAVQRILGLTQAPSAMALGAANDPGLAEAVGAAVGRGLISLGINWNFAPVLDVNTNPDNPVIGDRSFGSDPQKVAELAVAWGKGLETAGVMAAVKHFPGHGDTAIDTHLDLPVVDKGLGELEQTELLPFRRAIKAGLGAVMTAHILFPQLDPQDPATLSPFFLRTLLRQQMGFDGVLVTDALDMQAITRRYPVEQAAVKSLQAGADMILAFGNFEVQACKAEAISRAIENGDLPAAQVQASLERLERAIARFPGVAQPYSQDQLEADRALMQRAAQQSITSIGPLIRPKPTDRVLLIAAQSASSAGPYGTTVSTAYLVEGLKQVFPKLSTYTYAETNPLAGLATCKEAVKDADFVLLTTLSRDALSPTELHLFDEVAALGKPTLHLALWNPYWIAKLNLPALISYGFREPSLDALIQVLKGQTSTGTLPFTLPESPLR